MKLDIRAYKKVEHTDTHATLQHPDGHEVKVDHRRLSPNLRAHLAAMPLHKAEGGVIQDQQPQNPQQPVINVNVGGQPQPINPMPAPAPLPPTLPPNAVPAPVPAPQIPLSEGIGQFVGNHVLQPVVQGVKDTADAYGRIGGALSNFGQGVAKGVDATIPALPQNQPPQKPQLENVPLQPAQPQAQDQSLGNGMMQATDAYSKAYLGGLGQQEQGIRAEADAAAAKGQQMTNAAVAHQSQMQDLKEHYDGQYKRIDGEVQALSQDIKNGHINPNQYMENMSTAGRVRTALGLLVSGVGAGGTGKENMAYNYLNKQIDRNIDAQKANMDKRHNLLSALLKQEGNLHDATQMYRAFQMDDYKSMLEQIAGTYAGPEAQARASQAIGKLETESAAIKSQLAMRKTLAAASGQQAQMDPSVQVRFAEMAGYLPKEHTAEAYKEIKEQQNISAINKMALDSFDKITKESTLANALNPQSHKRIEALWSPMMDKITKENSGRVTPVTVELMSTLKPSRTDSQETIKAKRQKLIEVLSGQRSSPTLDAYGIQLDKHTGEKQAPRPMDAMPGYSKRR